MYLSPFQTWIAFVGGFIAPSLFMGLFFYFFTVTCDGKVRPLQLILRMLIIYYYLLIDTRIGIEFKFTPLHQGHNAQHQSPRNPLTAPS